MSFTVAISAGDCLHRSLDALAATITAIMANQNTLSHPNRPYLSNRFRLVAQL